MSRLIFKELSTEMEDTIAGAVQVYTKSDGTTYDDGLYIKRSTSAQKLVGNPAADSQGIIRYNSQTLSETVTIPANVNAFSAGPLTIDTGSTVTISSGSFWTII